MNSYTIFQGSQLLEPFRLLEKTRLPLHELQKRVPPKGIDPLVPQYFQAFDFVASKRDGGAREVQGAPGPIDDDFHLVRRRDVTFFVKWMRGSHEFCILVS